MVKAKTKTRFVITKRARAGKNLVEHLIHWIGMTFNESKAWLPLRAWSPAQGLYRTLDRSR